MSQEITRQELIAQTRKAFGWRGTTKFELGELVTPTFDLADPTPPFHTKIGGVSTYVRAAAVGFFSLVALGFRTGRSDNAAIVVRKMSLWCPGVAVATPVRVGVAAAVAVGALNGVTTNGTWDSVSPAVTSADVVRTVGQVYEQTPALVIAESGSFNFHAPGTNATNIVPPLHTVDFVVRPDNYLVCQCSVANQALAASFYWDEYYLG